MQDTPDARLVADLLRRQLFELAEHHCRDLLARSDLDDDRRVDLTLQLVRVLTSRAVNSPAGQRAALWPQAADAVQALAAALPQHPRLVQVELELQWCRLKQGEWLRLEAELEPDPARILENAQDTLREAIRALQSLRDTVAPGGPRPAAGPNNRLSTVDRQKLQSQIEFALGEAFRQQALCFAEGSPDQIHLLTRALELHNSIARLSGDSEMSIASHLAEIECLRRLRRFDTAADRLQKLQSRALNEQDHLRMTIQHAGLLMDTGRMESAADLLLAAPRPHEADEELLARADLTLMETYVALWRDAVRRSDSAEAEQWRARALEGLGQLKQSRSAYWVRRAEWMLTPLGETASAAGDLPLLERAAERLYQQKEYAEAVDTYHRAASLARQLGDDPQAFRLELRSAAIRRQIGHHQEALQALQQLARSFPRHEGAPQAHLLAITSAALLARDTPDQLATYVELLQEHLAQWPDAPTASQVRDWYGNLQQAQGRLDAALDLWTQIDPTFSQFDRVVQSVCSSGLQQLEHTGATDGDRQRTARQIAGFLEQTFLEDSTVPDRWTDQQRWAAAAAARFRLWGSPDELRPVADYLTASLESVPTSAPSQATMRALLGLCRLRAQQWTEARQQFSQVDWKDVEQPLELVVRFSRPTQTPASPPSPEEAAIRVEVGRQLQDLAASWPIDQQQQLALYRALGTGRLRRPRRGAGPLSAPGRRPPS